MIGQASGRVGKAAAGSGTAHGFPAARPGD